MVENTGVFHGKKLLITL